MARRKAQVLEKPVVEEPNKSPFTADSVYVIEPQSALDDEVQVTKEEPESSVNTNIDNSVVAKLQNSSVAQVTEQEETVAIDASEIQFPEIDNSETVTKKKKSQPKLEETVSVLEFSAEIEEFKSHLTAANLAVPNRPHHPSLNNVQIKANDGQVTFTTFDMSLGIIIRFSSEVALPGEVAVPAKLLSDIISHLPAGTISFTAKQSVNSGLIVDLNCGGHYQIRATSTEGFPALPEFDNIDKFIVNPVLLALAMRCVSFAAASDETRPVLFGVHFNVNSETIELVATDAHRLAFASIPNPEGDVTTESINFTVPIHNLLQIEKILFAQTEPTITIEWSRSKAKFNSTNTSVVTRLLDGQYPSYRQLIPTEFSASIVVQRRALISILERLVVLTHAKKKNAIILNISAEEQSLFLAVENSDVGCGSETIKGQVEGTSIKLAANAKYLLEGLKKLDCTDVLLKFTSPTTAMIISAIDSAIDTLQVLMPIELTSQ